MKRKMENFGSPGGRGRGHGHGRAVNCKKNGCGCRKNRKKPSRESGAYREPTPTTKSGGGKDSVRRYPKYPPAAKMKGVYKTSCTLKPIPVFDMRRTRRARGESSYEVCTICEDAKAPGEMERWAHCRHKYCHGCIKEYVRGKVKDDIQKIKCPEPGCDKNLDLESCLESIDSSPQLLERLIDAEVEAKVLANPSEIKCPFRDCSKTFMDDGKGFLIRACPHCWKIFCMECRVNWHMGMSCCQYNFAMETIKNLLLQGDAMKKKMMTTTSMKKKEFSYVKY